MLAGSALQSSSLIIYFFDILNKRLININNVYLLLIISNKLKLKSSSYTIIDIIFDLYQQDLY